jgi:glycosyltransferase involved in cell wall biosynthesis
MKDDVWRIAFALKTTSSTNLHAGRALHKPADHRRPIEARGSHPRQHVRRRVRFGLPDDTCVVLAALDLKSTSERKNPLGAMEAYRRAAPVADGRAVLVCKVTGGARWPERLAELEGAAGGRDDIRLLVEDLSDADMGRLVASADVIVSLHRAEGFGLLAAEGLCDGKAVVGPAGLEPATRPL